MITSSDAARLREQRSALFRPRSCKHTRRANAAKPNAAKPNEHASSPWANSSEYVSWQYFKLMAPEQIISTEGLYQFFPPKCPKASTNGVTPHVWLYRSGQQLIINRSCGMIPERSLLYPSEELDRGWRNASVLDMQHDGQYRLQTFMAGGEHRDLRVRVTPAAAPGAPAPAAPGAAGPWFVEEV